MAGVCHVPRRAVFVDRAGCAGAAAGPRGAIGGGDTLLFHVRFDVHQPEGVDNSELVAIWRREAAAALEAIQAGAVKHLWKVAGQRVVFGIVDLPTAEDLDRALGSLP